jgi:hypothetical protein
MVVGFTTITNVEHDVQDAINILWTPYSCLGISTAFSLPDMIIILLFQVTSFKERFLLKYKSTVSHQLSGPTIYMLHKARISSPKNINCILYIMFIPHLKI